MPLKPRAFVVAIENYPKAKGLAAQLPGTLKAANDFVAWLKQPKGLDDDSIVVCRDEQATMPDFLNALDTFIKRFRYKTSELFFFFSGHGFGAAQEVAGQPLDILAFADFQGVDALGANRSCARVLNLKEMLAVRLGGTEHYYFIDACRNEAKDMPVAPISGAAGEERLSEPSGIHLLYSTAAGAPARTDSGFADALVKGLCGDGHAKDRLKNDFWVKFDRLGEYLAERVPKQKIRPSSNNYGGYILKLTPPPIRARATILVPQAGEEDTFLLKVSLGDNELPQKTFQGTTYDWDLEPNSAGYRFEVSAADGTSYEQVGPDVNVFIDMFNGPVELTFMKPTGDPADKIVISKLDLTPFRDSDLSKKLNVHIENLLTGLSSTGRFLTAGADPLWVPSGKYKGTVLQRGAPVRTKIFNVAVEQSREVDLFAASPSKPLRSILKNMPTLEDGRVAQFAEFGPVLHGDLNLHLSLMGAARILRPRTHPSFDVLGLESFQGLSAQESAIYVLASSEAPGSIRLGWGAGPEINWSELRKIPKLSGIFEGVTQVPAGSHLLSLSLPQLPPVTFAACALPNQATFFVVTADRAGVMRVNQFILPVHALRKYLSPRISQRVLGAHALKTVDRMYQVQQKFAARQPIDLHKDIMLPIYSGAWLNPILTLMSAFESVRRGGLRSGRRHLANLTERLEAAFPEIPDSAVLRSYITGEKPKLAAPPLLREALLSTTGSYENLPLPANRLEHGFAWTCWTNAVDAPR